MAEIRWAGACARLAGAAGLLLLTLAPLRAATDIAWWHAMSGELGRQLEKLAEDFNASQPDFRIVPVYKGNYSETISASIFAFRSRSQPAIVQVNEVATATMMAAKGAVYPVHQLMRDQAQTFSSSDYLPGVTAFYSDLSGNMLSFPFNSSTPILYYNKDLFRRAGLKADVAPATWAEVGEAGRRLRVSGVPCGFTTAWPSWINVENVSALHDVPVATQANGFGGLDTSLVINNSLIVRHVGQLADWQRTKIFDYGGRATAAEPRFQTGECGIFIGSSATRADIMKNASFEVGFGPMPYWADVKTAPRNTIIGGATLWVLRSRPAREYEGVAQFFAFLSRPEVQAQWHQATGYLPVTRAAYEYSRERGYYDRNPGSAIAVEQVLTKIPTENSRGLRLGSFVLIRDVIDDELEQAFSGKKTAQEAMDSAVARGNRLLRQFERTNR
ncbi:MAG: sn-glycerol-3-phosphate ABC transporter substrate-binding protein UgpB [Xanthobacteraceae bacterium]